jgi:molecular chaperone Hsp33
VSGSDRLRRFLFEDAPVRGHWVHLSRAWIEAREHQVLPAEARNLLGEALAATTLLSASLKFTGTMTLQLGGSTGPVSMLVAQATDNRTMRGVAHVVEGADTAGLPFPELVKGGRLVVSVEQGERSPAWQGVVPLSGASLGRCLEDYFAASEQLPTAIMLAANEYSAAGLLLQKLPGHEGEGGAVDTQELWEEVAAMMATLTAGELLELPPEKLLGNLFGMRDIRLFDAEPVSFACRCDRERVAAMLRGLGRDEVESIVAELGEVVVTCEFCRKPYRFDAVDAAELFLPVSPGNSSVN